MQTVLPRAADKAGLDFDLAGARLRALTCGGLWWEAERALVVSDLHLEKASAYAARGQMLPPYDTKATLARLERQVAALAPRLIISLGDSFHDRRARPRMADDDVQALRRLTGACGYSGARSAGRRWPRRPTRASARA